MMRNGPFLAGPRQAPGMSLLRHSRALTLGALIAFCTSLFAAETGVERARKLWLKSPHGAMLERILPETVAPDDLPDPGSPGARLTVRYCVQCHHLPSPHMHTAERWKPVVERMVWRMRGHGNMGVLMKTLMDEVDAPTDAEVEALTRYLERHGQREIDPRHPGLASRAGQIYVLACSQCHAPPDPQRHTATDWPRVVERMTRHMAWANTVVGVPALRTVPELKTEEIVRFLQRHSRKPRQP
jgi:hypothetical protein